MSFLILFACKSSSVYQSDYTFENHSWNRFKKVFFETPMNDTKSTYAIYVNVKVTEKFEFDKLSIRMTIYTPDKGERYSEHDIQIKGDDGKFKGEAEKEYRVIKIPLKKEIYFNQEGKYMFEIENLMSKYETPGIISIGISIEKVKSDS